MCRWTLKVTQFAAIVPTAVLVRPHLAVPTNQSRHRITSDFIDSSCSRMDTKTPLVCASTRTRKVRKDEQVLERKRCRQSDRSHPCRPGVDRPCIGFQLHRSTRLLALEFLWRPLAPPRGARDAHAPSSSFRAPPRARSDRRPAQRDRRAGLGREAGSHPCS